MKRRLRMIVGTAAALFFIVFSIPGTAVADPCPETTVVTIECPQRHGYFIYVCIDHHGIITVYSECFPPGE